MNKFNYFDIDGKLLNMLLVILETGSITKTAEKLNLTQSAVSHSLDRLRKICNDPLFVRSGRSISPTEHAKQLGREAQKLLDSLQHFSQGSAFEPQTLDLQWTIAANDLQRDLLLPHLARRLNKEAPGVSLKIISSGVPNLQLLRDQDCQLAITPRPPEGSDIYQKRIFEDQYVVFYDAKSRKPPSSKEDYLKAKHISVDYDVPRPLAIDEYLNGMGFKRDFQVLVPSFAGIPAFMKGSKLLATLPSLLSAHLLEDMAQCEPPFKCPKMAMYMCWHKKYNSDPVQQWLRSQLIEVAKEVIL